MRKSPFSGTITPFLLLLSSFIVLQSQAQSKKGIDWNTDTVSMNSASTRATKFRTDLNNSGKKATRIFILPVDKLKDIMDACYARGVTDVKVMVVSIRKEDTAHYAKRNPNLTAAERSDLIGRQAIVIRVPRQAFGESGSGIAVPKSNPLMMSLLTAGMIQLDKHAFAELAPFAGDYYFEFGSICPPPNSCDN